MTQQIFTPLPRACRAASCIFLLPMPHTLPRTTHPCPAPMRCSLPTDRQHITTFWTRAHPLHLLLDSSTVLTAWVMQLLKLSLCCPRSPPVAVAAFGARL